MKKYMSYFLSLAVRVSLVDLKHQVQVILFLMNNLNEVKFI